MNKNYESKLWALIYDQYDEFSERGNKEFEFYLDELKDVKGKVLEIGCGTGKKLIRYLEKNINMYGVDISEEMLKILFKTGNEKGFENINERVSRQDMINFSYPSKFERIIIPARTFLHLSTQDEQIAALKNIYKHLEKNGKLILNFFQPNLRVLSSELTNYQFFANFTNPNNEEQIKLSSINKRDSLNQLITIDWKFETEQKEFHSEMLVKWIYKLEFELLLKLAGFIKIDVFGDFDKSELSEKSVELIWIVNK